MTTVAERQKEKLLRYLRNTSKGVVPNVLKDFTQDQLESQVFTIKVYWYPKLIYGIGKLLVMGITLRFYDFYWGLPPTKINYCKR